MGFHRSRNIFVITTKLAERVGSRGSFISCPEASLSRSLSVFEDKPNLTTKEKSPTHAAGKQVSKKAHNTLGKVHTFSRIAAAKMSRHRSVKVDVSEATLKRRLPADKGEKEPDVAGNANPEIAAPALTTPPKKNVPPFLGQSLSG